MASICSSLGFAIILLLLVQLPAVEPGLPHTCSAWGAAGESEDSLCGSWLQRSDSSLQPSEEEQRLFSRYIATCREYGIQPSAGVLNRLQLRSGRLALEPVGDAERCGDLEVRALVMLLEDGDGLLLSGLKTLDLSKCSLGVSSSLLIASLVRHPRSCLETLDLSNQWVGAEGACALSSALSLGPGMGPKVVRLREAGLGDEGGLAMLRLLRNASNRSLQELDLQNNFISFRICQDLKAAAKTSGVTISLKGNRVLDEVYNAVTHGVGEIFVIFGCIVMGRTLKGKPEYFYYAAIPYLVSLNILYLSSTLFHSFFALGQETVYIFQVLDFCAIFILIAGSYTPLLGILFHGQRWASILLAAMWTTALLGICTAAFYRGPFQTAFRLFLFLGMGWTAIACISAIVREIGNKGAILLFLGGVMYTAGVPFFVRAEHTFGFPDHAIWHLFVMSGSACHYFCILWYVVGRDAKIGDDTSAITDDDEESDDEEYVQIPKASKFC